MVSRLCFALVAAGAASACAAGSDPRPPIMDAAFEARNFDKADIHVRVEDSRGWMEYRTRKAGFELLNDRPQRASLHYEGKVWSITNPDYPIVLVYDSDRPQIHGNDLRYIGLGTLWFMDTVPAFAPDATDFGTETDGNLTTVICDEGQDNCIYVFDSTQGNSLVHIEKYFHSHVKIFDLVNAQYDGFWFPQTIVTAIDGQWRSTATVLSAKFERPELPDHLGPSDLNVGLGSRVILVDANNAQHGGFSYDGTQIVPQKVAWQMRQSGSYPEETWCKVYPLMPMQFTFPDPDED